MDADEAIVAADALCGQALEAQAEDMAIEDTLYALERAFQSGALDAPVYLKQVSLFPNPRQAQSQDSQGLEDALYRPRSTSASRERFTRPCA